MPPTQDLDHGGARPAQGRPATRDGKTVRDRGPTDGCWATHRAPDRVEKLAGQPRGPRVPSQVLGFRLKTRKSGSSGCLLAAHSFLCGSPLFLSTWGEVEFGGTEVAEHMWPAVAIPAAGGQWQSIQTPVLAAGLGRQRGDHAQHRPLAGVSPSISG